MAKQETRTLPSGRRLWETPSLRLVGSIGQVFQMPGVGKVTIVQYDSGDVPRQPKGLAPK